MRVTLFLLAALVTHGCSSDQAGGSADAGAGSSDVGGLGGDSGTSGDAGADSALQTLDVDSDAAQAPADTTQDAAADTASDAAADSQTPIVTNTFASGQRFVLSVDEASIEKTPGLNPHPEEYLPWTPMDLSLAADGGSLGAWLSLESPLITVASGIVDGQPLTLSSPGPFGAGGSADSGTVGWELTNLTLTLSGADIDGDGLSDWLTGTLEADVFESQGDYEVSGTLSAEVTGTLDPGPAVASVSAQGEWPGLRLLVRFTKLVSQGAVQQAVIHTVDGATAGFSVTSVGGGPAGVGALYAIEPDAPYEPGATVAVSVGAVSDLGGQASTPAGPVTASMPALPTIVLTADSDFSTGMNPFTEGAPTSIVAAVGSVAAPTGGAMVAIELAPQGGTARAGIHVPAGATTLRIDAATLIPDSGCGSVTFHAYVAVAAGGTGAIFGAPVNEPAEVASAPYTLTTFKEIPLDVSAMAGKDALLAISADVDTSFCFGGGLDAPAWHLIDRVRFE